MIPYFTFRVSNRFGHCYITVHKPRGTICFLNAPLAEFAVPMYGNQPSFSRPCSKNTE